jgi:hypothetical protein
MSLKFWVPIWIAIWLGAVVACTIHVDVPQPELTVDCVSVSFPGSNVVYCDAGKDARKDAP